MMSSKLLNNIITILYKSIFHTLDPWLLYSTVGQKETINELFEATREEEEEKNDDCKKSNKPNYVTKWSRYCNYIS